MAIEPKRGCGYRKVGGLYMVAKGMWTSCHRLPKELTTCPTCQAGIKQARGWTWVNGAQLMGRCPTLEVDKHCQVCPMCQAEPLTKAGLLWVGERFYPSPADFTAEVAKMGLSKRIKAIPQGFKMGETWVLLGHPKAVPDYATGKEENAKPGIFQVFKPTAIEQLITKSQATKEMLEGLEKRKITPVIVPDDDPDHQGTVYDKAGEDEDDGQKELEMESGKGRTA